MGTELRQALFQLAQFWFLASMIMVIIYVQLSNFPVKSTVPEIKNSIKRKNTIEKASSVWPQIVQFSLF